MNKIIFDENKINRMVEIELDETRHNDYIENYDSKLDFYLSNTQSNSYLDYLYDVYKCEYDIELDLLELIQLQKLIIDKISDMED